MAEKIKNVTIILKPNIDDHFRNIVPNLTSWLSNRKCHVSFLESEEERIKKYLKKIPKSISFLDFNAFHKNSDLLISLGGDGTLIGCARKSTSKSPPIFGVNMGTLGFITEFNKVELFDELAHVLKNKYEIYKLPLYQVQVFDGEKSLFKSSFINDLTVGKNDLSRMITLSLSVGTEHVYDTSGDGLIISSPIGSTAYSLAAGGPMVHPSVNSMILTPICPHSLTHRPIVIPDKEIINVKLNGASNIPVLLTLDGQESYTLGPKDIVIIRRSKSSFSKLIQNKNRSYFHTLREKFTYGRQGR